MADTVAVTCPHCTHAMTVPGTLAGKKIKCKKCNGIVPVPEAGGGGTLKFADEPPKPGKAKPVAKAAKPVAKAAPAKPEEATASRPAPEGFDEDGNPYGVTADDLDVPRCPFCAYELDPPDTKICFNCGFNLLERRRHESRKVYEHTTGDFVIYHLTTVLAFFVVFFLIFLIVFCYIMMPTWFEGSIFEMDEINPDTQKKKMYAPPGVCTLWIVVPSLFGIWKAGKFAITKLIYRIKPPEKIKSK